MTNFLRQVNAAKIADEDIEDDDVVAEFDICLAGSLKD